MIWQSFFIPRYNWQVRVYYYVDTYYAGEILALLARMDIDDKNYSAAAKNLMSGNLNQGLCYSNPRKRESVIVISKTDSPEQFVNSYDHEKNHLLKQMESACGIDPYSEEAAYLAGEIGQLMFAEGKKFMCHCHGLK